MFLVGGFRAPEKESLWKLLSEEEQDKTHLTYNLY